MTWVAYNLIKDKFRIPSYKFTYSRMNSIDIPGPLFVTSLFCYALIMMNIYKIHILALKDLSLNILFSCIQEGVEGLDIVLLQYIPYKCPESLRMRLQYKSSSPAEHS